MELEVPVARLSAERCSDPELRSLRATLVSDGRVLLKEDEDQFSHQHGFHETLIDACGNRLLGIAAQPIFAVLQLRLAQSALTRADYQVVHQGHVRLYAALEAGDPEASGKEMRRHLDELAPISRRAWRTRGSP